MATSGSTNFTVTGEELISSAYELARVKDPDETLTSQQTSIGLKSINKLIKFFQKNGMPLWAVKRAQVNLIKGQQSYTCGVGGNGLTERPLRILEAFYRDGTSDIEIERVSREEYWALGDKSAEGHPHQIYYDPQLTLGVLYVYNPADAASAGNDLHLVFHRPFEDMDSLTDEFDFPQEWYMALEYRLALDIALRNGIKQARIAELRYEATQYFDEVSWWDREDTGTQVVPHEN